MILLETLFLSLKNTQHYFVANGTYIVNNFFLSFGRIQALKLPNNALIENVYFFTFLTFNNGHNYVLAIFLTFKHGIVQTYPCINKEKPISCE